MNIYGLTNFVNGPSLICVCPQRFLKTASNGIKTSYTRNTRTTNSHENYAILMSSLYFGTKGIN
jgi:hypothetical protein